MNRQRVLIGVLLATALVIVAGLVLLPRFVAPHTLTGYVEGEALYLASPLAGTVTEMHVVRGQEVPAGAALFVVDPQQASAAMRQAAATLAAAQAQAVDARKGQRPPEIQALEANVAAAQARAHNADVTLARVSEMAAAGVTSRQALDDARAEARTSAAQLEAARRQRDVATLGSREDQIRAADARVGEAQAAMEAAKARLADLAPRSPEAARIEDVFFQLGEWAPANQPILSLLPDKRIYVKFFVPERSLAAYHLGGTVRFSCDGCPKNLTATITYISPRAEFTPPVIYSQDSRDRLVYQIWAHPSLRMNPGQPVDVVPLEVRR
jgi:HlyD family secretion protein